MTKENIRTIDGVQYVTTYGSNIRVVFEHRADTGAIEQIEEITECSGELGATQEHLCSIEYPQSCLETDA